MEDAADWAKKNQWDVEIITKNNLDRLIARYNDEDSERPHIS